MTMSNDTVVQIFGGSPLAVVGRLVLVSILVGVVLSVLGLDPFDIVRSIEQLVRSVWETGFDALRWLWRYFLLGALIVIPTWLVTRIGKVSQEKQSKTSSPSESDGRLA